VRTRRWVASALYLAFATAVVHVALAQSHRGAKKPKTTPAAASPDAGAESATAAEDSAASAPATAPSATTDAGANAPVPRPEVGDGGVKPSPLNPAPNELPPPPSPQPDYDKVLGDIAALRARVAAVSDTLFRSRIALTLESSGNHVKLARLTVAVDDGVVYTMPAGFRGEDKTAIYDHGVAPGKHAVTVEVERKDDRDETFRTSQRSRFMVDVPKDARLEVNVSLDDDSSMGGDFPGDRSGKYDLRIRAKAAAKLVR
jgi:hypothetical protein